jgi:hypothetical protein
VPSRDLAPEPLRAPSILGPQFHHAHFLGQLPDLGFFALGHGSEPAILHHTMPNHVMQKNSFKLGSALISELGALIFSTCHAKE